MTDEIAVKLTLCFAMFVVFTFFMYEAIFSESRRIRITALILSILILLFKIILVFSLL